MSHRHDLDSVLSTLDGLEQCMCAMADPNAYFAALYRATTRCCRSLVHAAYGVEPRHRRIPRDLDPRLITDIVNDFAPRYVDNYFAFGRGELATDDPWHAVFAHAREGSPYSVMLLGAHTHITFDLARVLARDLEPGRPLYDHQDRRQRRTLDALNRLFMADLGTIMDNVAVVERRLAGCGSPNTGGAVRLLHNRAVQSLTRGAWRWLLAAARDTARDDSLRLRCGELDVSRLAARVRRRNQRLSTWHRRLSHRRRYRGAESTTRG